jgi:hypothetical protein
LDKNKKIAALLESLCERPFEGHPQGQAPGTSAMGSRIAQALSDAETPRSGSASEAVASSGAADDPARLTAELAAILSGTATVAPCHAFQEAAVTSGAVRLEAQSALAFVEGIEQAPLEAPAHLLEQVLTSAGGTPAGGRAATPKPGIWSRIVHGRLGRRPAQVVVATCAVMLMAGGLSWSLLWRPGDLDPRGVAAPAGTNSKEAPSLGDIAPEPSPSLPSMPAASAPQALAPAPPLVPAPALAPAPVPAPAPVILPTPTLAPARSAVQAFADPCEPGGSAKSAAGAPSPVETAKRAPKLPSKTAAVAAPEPGCAVTPGAVEAGQNPLAQNPLAQNPLADVGPLPAAPPPAKIGRSDRASPAAAASAPAAARPASPAMRPTAIQPAR